MSDWRLEVLPSLYFLLSVHVYLCVCFYLRKSEVELNWWKENSFLIDLWAFRNLDDLESFIPLSWGLRSRKHKDAVRHQYTCWLWTHLLSLGVRRQEHFNFDFSIWYKILSCPTFFFILLHSMNFYNLFQSKDDLIDCTDPIIEWRYRLLFLCLYFFTCQFFFLPFKACLYINYVNFMYFFVPDVIWDYVISSNFAIIQRRFALKLNATDLQSMGPQRPQHNWATKHTHHNGSVGKCFWIHQK